TARRQVTLNVTLEVDWGFHFDFHDWFKQYWLRCQECFFERGTSSNFERHLRRVDWVITTVRQFELRTNYLATCQWTFDHGFFEAFFNTWDVFFWYRTTDSFVVENE